MIKFRNDSYLLIDKVSKGIKIMITLEFLFKSHKTIIDFPILNIPDQA